jgi:hypothetical protein
LSSTPFLLIQRGNHGFSLPLKEEKNTKLNARAKNKARQPLANDEVITRLGKRSKRRISAKARMNK